MTSSRCRSEDPKAFEVLSRVPATFQKIHYDRPEPVHLEYRRPHIEVNHTGKVINVFWSPAFEVRVRFDQSSADRTHAASVQRICTRNFLHFRTFRFATSPILTGHVRPRDRSKPRSRTCRTTTGPTASLQRWSTSTPSGKELLPSSPTEQRQSSEIQRVERWPTSTDSRNSNHVKLHWSSYLRCLRGSPNFLPNPGYGYNQAISCASPIAGCCTGAWPSQRRQGASGTSRVAT